MADYVNIFFIKPAMALLQCVYESIILKVLYSIIYFKSSSSSSIDPAILKIPSARQISLLFFIVSIRIDKISGTFLFSSIDLLKLKITYYLNYLFKQSKGLGFLDPWIADLTTLGVGVWIVISFVIYFGHLTRILNILSSEISWISSILDSKLFTFIRTLHTCGTVWTRKWS